MDNARLLLLHLPDEAVELVSYRALSAEEIRGETGKGKLPVWVDDKIYTKLSDEYMEGHFLTFVSDLGEFDALCKKLSGMEREIYGLANTRYNCRVPGHTEIFYEDIINASDITQEQVERFDSALRKGVDTPQGTMILDGSYRGLPPPLPKP